MDDSNIIYITPSNYFELSNDYVHDLLIDGMAFHSAEQAYQFELWKNFPEMRDQILNCDTPKQAKQIGSLYNFCKTYGGDTNTHVYVKSQWYYLMKKFRDVQENIMSKVLYHKFDDPKLQEILLSTGEKTLRLERNKSALPHGSSFYSFSWMWWNTNEKLISVNNGSLGDHLCMVRMSLRRMINMNI